VIKEAVDPFSDEVVRAATAEAIRGVGVTPA
jgi:hypothetical protein